MASSTRHLATRAAQAVFFLALAAHATAVIITLCRHDGIAIAKSWFADDTFYYLEVANHIAAGHGPTFDGVAATNGFHPLWMVCCTAMAAVTPRSAQTAVLFAVQGVLVALAAWWLRAALARCHAWAAGFAAALLLAPWGMQRVLMNGMESALGMACLAALFRFTMALPEGRITLGDRRQAIAAFLLLAGVALSRLEMGLAAAIWLAVGAWNARRDGCTGPVMRRLLAVTLGLAVTAASYVAINLWTADWPVPISGAVKWGQVETPEVYQRTVMSHVGTFVATLRPLLLSDARWFTSAAAVGLAACFAWHLAAVRAWRQPLAVFAGIGTTFAVFVIQRSGGFTWYQWPTLFVGVLATFAALERLHSDLLVHRPRLAAAIALLTAAWVATAPLGRALRARPTILFDWQAPERLWDASLEFLRDRIPTGDVVAGTAVGHLCFASGRPIVQAEGLVNDRAYLDALRRGDAAAELRRRGVRWIVGPVHRRADVAEVLGCYFEPGAVETIEFVGDAETAPQDVAFVRLRPPR